MSNKKWLSMLLSLIVSFGLWVYVVTVENPVGERSLSNIPVTFVGEDVLREDYDLLITDNNVPTGVTLTFSGKLSDLSSLSDKKSEIMINIDVSNLRSPKEYAFSFDLYDIAFPNGLSTQNFSLERGNPNQISVVVENLRKRSIPVRVLTEVDILEGYVADRLVQNYSEILIEGPEDIVNKVSYAQAVLKRENVDQSITSNLSYQLVDNAGEPVMSTEITSDVKEIEVTLPILMYKDVPLEIPIIDGGGAAESDTLIDITPKTVRLSADPTILEAVQSIKLPAVDLSSLKTNRESLTRMIAIPEGCNNLSGEQEAVVSVQIRNKGIRQMRVSSNHFTYVGVPEQLQPIVRTSVLPVAIRANERDLEQITEENIRVVVDFSNITLTETASSMTVPVKIYVDGFEGAGVISESEYTVVVDLVPISSSE